MAAAGRNSKVQLLCYLLLIVATLIMEGDVLAARPSFSPSATTLQSSEQVQGVRLPRSEEEEGTAAAAGIISWSTSKEMGMRKRRRLVGSRAPMCTYNECRGCRHRCSARGVPVDASDPINSAYHYRCFCHI